VLQGGGALGAYQAGVYQALHESGLEPDWRLRVHQVEMQPLPRFAAVLTWKAKAPGSPASIRRRDARPCRQINRHAYGFDTNTTSDIAPRLGLSGLV
jgi:hypothetical protein